MSPDGTRIALTLVEGSNSDVWVYEVARGTLTRLTFDSGEDFNPVWSPDSQTIAFASEMKGGGPDLHVMAADGSEGPKELPVEPPTPPYGNVPSSWSPDGNHLLYSFGGDIWLLLVTGGSEPTHLGLRS